MFYTEKRYDLSKVGRYKVEQKLGRDYSEKDQKQYTTEVDGMLRIDDMIDSIKNVIALHAKEETMTNNLGKELKVRLDDIDHFSNRRIRTVGELVQNQVRVGLSRLERVVRERMTTQEPDAIKPQSFTNISNKVNLLHELLNHMTKVIKLKSDSKTHNNLQTNRHL